MLSRPKAFKSASMLLSGRKQTLPSTHRRLLFAILTSAGDLVNGNVHFHRNSAPFPIQNKVLCAFSAEILRKILTQLSKIIEKPLQVANRQLSHRRSLSDSQFAICQKASTYASRTEVAPEKGDFRRIFSFSSCSHFSRSTITQGALSELREIV